jgi:hypothetical protein
MSDKEKKKRLKGFAKILNAEFQKAFSNDSFREKFENRYEDTKLRVLLNPIDGRYAALISIENGNFEVESIRNKEENLTQEELNWDGKLETTTDLFMKLAMDQLSTPKIIWKWITRKIKVKNYKKVLEAFAVFM